MILLSRMELFDEAVSFDVSTLESIRFFGVFLLQMLEPALCCNEIGEPVGQTATLGERSVDWHFTDFTYRLLRRQCAS